MRAPVFLGEKSTQLEAKSSDKGVVGLDMTVFDGKGDEMLQKKQNSGVWMPIGWMICSAVCAGLCCLGGHALAQDTWATDYGNDAAAPSLAVETDAEVPYYKWTLETDFLALAFKNYGARFSWAPHAAHGVWLGLTRNQGDDPELELELGYHWLPFGQGVNGLAVGPLLGTATTSDATKDVWAGAEVGYRYPWRGLVFGGYVDVLQHGLFGTGASDVRVRPRIVVGWSWM